MIDHTDNIIDLNTILHPGSVYDHPREVVWASDAAAVARTRRSANGRARAAW